MRWVYRLQQRIAITRSECTVLLTLTLLFTLGLGARYLQGRLHPEPEASYAASLQRFAAASAAERDTAAVAVEPQPAPAEPVARAQAPRRKATLPDRPINLNTATAAQLQRLPRIGPKTAARILAYRDAHGPFRRVQDLTRVRGIGTKTLARLTPYLFVEPPP